MLLAARYVAAVAVEVVYAVVVAVVVVVAAVRLSVSFVFLTVDHKCMAFGLGSVLPV